MFYILSDNVIKITKGNSANIDIMLVQSETQEPVILEENDRILFTVKNMHDATVIQKTITSNDLVDGKEGTYSCEILPDDTIDLATGEYEYDCLLILADGQAITFVSSAFVIIKAVGLYTDIGGVEHE